MFFIFKNKKQFLKQQSNRLIHFSRIMGYQKLHNKN